MKRSPQARRRARQKKQLQWYREGYYRMCEHVGADSAFRELLGELLLKPEELWSVHPRFGDLMATPGHPKFKPLLIQRIRELLDKAGVE